MINRRLRATDGARASLKAEALTIDLARHLHVLLVFFTEQPFRIGKVDYPADRMTTMIEGADAQIHKDLNRSVEHARQAGGIAVSQAIAARYPIAAHAQEQGFDLIIAGHVGRSGTASRAVSSVTHQLMASASCPVLVKR